MSTFATAGRVMRSVAYLLLAVVGAWTFVGVFDTPVIIKPLWWALAAWMCVGGVSCLIGQSLRRWVGEFIGLPLVGSSLIGLGILQANLYQWSVEIFTSTALLLAFGLLLLARWRDVLVLYRTAVMATARGGGR